MKALTLKELNSFCDKSKCLRGNSVNKRCLLLERRVECLTKLNKIRTKEKKKPEKKKVVKKDEKWLSVSALVHKRDVTCRITSLLTQDELAYITKNHSEAGAFSTLTVAHIKTRAAFPELYYDLSNLVLISWFFHSRLDQYRHPVTGKAINKEIRDLWMYSALKRVRDARLD